MSSDDVLARSELMARAQWNVGGSKTDMTLGDHRFIALLERAAFEAAEFVAAERVLEVVDQALVAIGAFLSGSAARRPSCSICGRFGLAISGRPIDTPSQAPIGLRRRSSMACWKPPVHRILMLGSILRTASAIAARVVDIDALDDLAPPPGASTGGTARPPIGLEKIGS